MSDCLLIAWLNSTDPQPTLSELQTLFPNRHLTLLLETPPVNPSIPDVLIWHPDWQTPAHTEVWIQQLHDRHFTAALIFTPLDRSPYSLAYLCYLAGIPLRLGNSQEFGGSTLTHPLPNLPNLPTLFPSP